MKNLKKEIRNWVCREAWDQIDEHLWKQVWEPVWEHVRWPVRRIVNCHVRDYIENNVWFEVMKG